MYGWYNTQVCKCSKRTQTQSKLFHLWVFFFGVIKSYPVLSSPPIIFKQITDTVHQKRASSVKTKRNQLETFKIKCFFAQTGESWSHLHSFLVSRLLRQKIIQILTTANMLEFFPSNVQKNVCSFLVDVAAKC